jgi:hypothetical protein
MFDNIKHLGQNFCAGQTLEWWGEDNQENFVRHTQDTVSKDRLAQAGWLDQKIIYKFNRLGFRSAEFESVEDYFCSFGCSFTFGQAIQQQQRYTDLVAEKTNLTSYNFGIPGGNDSASFRLAYTWLDKIQPKFVIYQTTFPQRFEVIDGDVAFGYGVQAALGGKVPDDHGKVYKQLMATESNGQILAIKNQLAMRELCRTKRIKLIEISYIDFLRTHDNNSRDLHHPGALANCSVAALVLSKL